MTTNDKTPVVAGVPSENLSGDSDSKRNNNVTPLDVRDAAPSSSWPDDAQDPEGSSDDQSVYDVNHAEGRRESAIELVKKFVESVRNSGTLIPNGRIDKSVLAAAAWLTRDSDDFLGEITVQLYRTGADSDEVDDWAQAVERKAQGRAIELLPAGELINRPDPEYLIDGLLEMGGFSMLYADSGAGKTFVALSWCFCIAGGILWLGRELKQGPVVYIAAEGVGGLAKRLRALMIEHRRDEPPADLYVIEQSVNLLSPVSMGEAIAAAEEIGVRPVLVVFDTYARSMAGGDENSARDVGLVVRAIDNFRYRLRTNVLVVHHTTKTGSGDRGSGALTGAVDTKIFVAGPPGNMSLVIEKQKNFEAGDPIPIGLEPLGESLVVRDRVVGRPGFPVATSGGDKDADVMEAILKALQKATDDGLTPIGQSRLLKQVTGNMGKKSTLLHRMAEDPNYPVAMNRRGKTNLYTLDTATVTDSDSIPPSP